MPRKLCCRRVERFEAVWRYGGAFESDNRAVHFHREQERLWSPADPNGITQTSGNNDI